MPSIGYLAWSWRFAAFAPSVAMQQVQSGLKIWDDNRMLRRSKTGLELELTYSSGASLDPEFDASAQHSILPTTPQPNISHDQKRCMALK